MLTCGGKTVISNNYNDPHKVLHGLPMLSSTDFSMGAVAPEASEGPHPL